MSQETQQPEVQSNMSAELAQGMAEDWISREIEGGTVFTEIEPQQGEDGRWYLVAAQTDGTNRSFLLGSPMISVDVETGEVGWAEVDEEPTSAPEVPEDGKRKIEDV